MSGAKFEVAKFDGQGNFGLWQTRVKDLLAQQGILKALRSTKPVSMEEEDREELQQRAAGTIRLCLADEVMYHVMHLSSPDEIWRKDDHDLAQHVNVFNQIVSDLARLDVKIEDEDRAMILLCSLPPSYEHMVTTLTYEKETINVEEITAALLAHNQRKQNTGESSQADSLYVKGNRDRGRKTEKAGSVNSSSVYLGDDQCCNIVGIDEVRIKMYDGSVRTLSGVRHIPDLKKNLISLGTLHKNGFIPKADEDRETIRIVKDALTVEFIQLSPVMIQPNCGICVLLILVNVTKVRFKTAKHTTEGILDYVHSDSDVFKKFKLWKAEVENQTERKIKCLQSDNGTEYTDTQFLNFCKEHRIKRHFTVRKTPQQNGVAERMNRSLNERARCLRLNTELPKHFWAEAVNMACYLINRSPRASLAEKVAEEVWTGHDVSFDNLRIFGCPAYVHVPADERSKFDAKSKECIFLGYKKGVKRFKFWDPVAKKTMISRDVVFDEQFMLQQKKDTTVDYSLARDRVKRTNIKPPNRLGFEDLVSFALTVSSDDPVTFHDAVTSQENNKWMTAMVEEMESLNHNRTWELVPLPEGKKPIGCKWVYKKKPAVTGKEGEKFKARLVTKVFHSRKELIMMNFFLLWSEEQIYLRQLEGFTQPGNEHLVCRLKKSLYGLKQSPRQWYKRFDSYMIKIGYNRWMETQGNCGYLNGRDNPLVVGYVDSDYAGDLDNRRSTIWYVFTLGGGPICWKSTVQSVVALSTTEAEYIAAVEVTKEALCLTGLVKELGVQQGGDLISMTHKYTSKENRGWSGVSEHQLSLQRKSRRGGYDYVGWGYGAVPPRKIMPASDSSVSMSKLFINKIITTRRDDTKYLLWRQQVLFAIQSLALVGNMSIPSQYVVNNEGVKILSTDFLSFKQQDSALYSWPLVSISPSILPALGVALVQLMLSRTTGVSIWIGDLLNLQQFEQDDMITIGITECIKVAASDISSESRPTDKKRVIVVAIPVSAGLLLYALSCTLPNGNIIAVMEHGKESSYRLTAMVNTNNPWLKLPVLLFIWVFNCQLSFGADTISAKQSLTGNQTIVSSGGNFVLGFFAPGNSSNYYIGIWYGKISEQTPVWVANRETPVRDIHSSELKISDDSSGICFGRCRVYALCGAFSICNRNNYVACNCLTGFQPASEQNWNKQDYSEGCVRKTRLQCDNASDGIGNGDRFLESRYSTFPEQNKMLGFLNPSTVAAASKNSQQPPLPTLPKPDGPTSCCRRLAATPPPQGTLQNARWQPTAFPTEENRKTGRTTGEPKATQQPQSTKIIRKRWRDIYRGSHAITGIHTNLHASPKTFENRRYFLRFAPIRSHLRKKDTGTVIRTVRSIFWCKNDIFRSSDAVAGGGDYGGRRLPADDRLPSATEKRERILFSLS
ncbi:hypothetical protein F3Y22_tig00111833pilonHSYRG00028 [Hibiscus syriacus]|uniref:Uncharacterized protein n=1 Tax=Hibiscus syriacus TaxID=106335 RepID=A0A6A2XBE7_HIBSY|nr:hypothetical protein F3Y22_tig00111833pilonHSYRG00028 [Hibiscus syriacus]